MNLEQKLAKLEREESYKIEQRANSKYKEWLDKWKEKAERKADEVARKIMTTYKRKREKLIRLSKWLTAKTPAQEREDEYKKEFRDAGVRFSLSVRIGGSLFDPTRVSFSKKCHTCGKVYVVCAWDFEKEKRCWNWSFQNWHMIKKWSGNWLKFYRKVCRWQCYWCNFWKCTEQEARSEQLRLEIGDEEHAKAKRSQWPKRHTIEELRKIKEESITIVENKLSEAEAYVKVKKV